MLAIYAENGLVLALPSLKLRGEAGDKSFFYRRSTQRREG